MLSFAAPGFAWALVIPAAVVALYLLRRKYVPRQVPSVFLWRKALQDHAANRPLQRLRKNLLLPVQLLAALVLALGLMQPYIPGGEAGLRRYEAYKLEQQALQIIDNEVIFAG